MQTKNSLPLLSYVRAQRVLVSEADCRIGDVERYNKDSCDSPGGCHHRKSDDSQCDEAFCVCLRLFVARACDISHDPPEEYDRCDCKQKPYGKIKYSKYAYED